MLSGRFAGRALAAGWFVYAGSARGPGGLKARLARHLRREKRIRWHIDQLTTRADALLALPFADGPGAPAPTECALIARLLESGLFAPPVNGFGSSDCRACPAHLLAWRPRA
jgi:Uri superfamily endonuclease